jgi:hypothetical protein
MMNRDSDIDLLIVDPNPANRHEESVRIRSAIGDMREAAMAVLKPYLSGG